MDYKQKYLKYKKKYLELKKQFGGYSCELIEGEAPCKLAPGCLWAQHRGRGEWGCYKQACLQKRTHMECGKTAGCAWDSYDNKCKHKHCYRRNKLDCKATAGCEWNNDNNRCTPDNILY